MSASQCLVCGPQGHTDERHHEALTRGADAAILTIADVAARIEVQQSTVRAYVTRGQMPAPTGRLGRTPWWSAQEIEPWLQSRKG